MTKDERRKHEDGESQRAGPNLIGVPAAGGPSSSVVRGVPALQAQSLAPRLRRALLRWYRTAARDLPWRRTADPYAIWVSEIMLQQTQVTTVLPYFERWMQRFPTVADLADAEEADVLQVWAGLGYYSRARALLRGAREVVARNRGKVPRRVEELKALPGIGPYTAGAIASIAFGLREPVVDGNVIRVLCRIFGLRGNPAAAPLRAELWRLAGLLVPPRAPGDFNSALMELGATICRPGKPDCHRCPVRALCAAHAAGVEEDLPELPKSPAAESLRMAAAVIERGDRILLVRRGPGACWAGLWQFPALEIGAGEDSRVALRRHLREALAIEALPERAIAIIRHGVTRYRVTLTAYRCQVERDQPKPVGYVACDWVPKDEIISRGLPSAHRRIAERIERGEEESQLELGYAG